ncbi:hypothetical protein EDC01DRAFT_743078 [Geopyxis carbonaria]|nr:hypothetical protein EDC01DRAFT_743078 [Geopyxis carbonaria]
MSTHRPNIPSNTAAARTPPDRITTFLTPAEPSDPFDLGLGILPSCRPGCWTDHVRFTSLLAHGRQNLHVVCWASDGPGFVRVIVLLPLHIYGECYGSVKIFDCAGWLTFLKEAHTAHKLDELDDKCAPGSPRTRFWPRMLDYGTTHDGRGVLISEHVMAPAHWLLTYDLNLLRVKDIMTQMVALMMRLMEYGYVWTPDPAYVLWDYQAWPAGRIWLVDFDDVQPLNDAFPKLPLKTMQTIFARNVFNMFKTLADGEMGPTAVKLKVGRNFGVEYQNGSHKYMTK